MDKIKNTNKRQQEQKQTLETDRRYYRRMYTKDRSITQEVPIIPMRELVQEER